jgi:KDO2-lipid IV(A) lauroyltransferase
VACNSYDLFRLPGLTATQLDSMVEVQGWENVVTALSLGKGVVMTSAHFGNVEMVIAAMLRRGVSMTIPAERIQPPQLYAYLTRLRTSRGLRLIPIDSPLTGLLRTLRRGGVVGIAADRMIGGRGRRVELFGQPTRLPDGHVRLAMRSGAPLMLGFGRRLARWDRCVARFWPHFCIPTGGSKEERLAAGMAYVVDGLETALREHPKQWAVTVPVWPPSRQGQIKQTNGQQYHQNRDGLTL